MNFVLSVAWSPSGKQIATGCLDERLRIVEAASGRIRREVPHAGHIEQAVWNPHGRLIATACVDGNLRVVTAATGKVEAEIPHTGWPLWRPTIWALAWSPSGRQIV